ncbi:MAG: DNA polymerase/3'-5' exonuclease PolX [Candidatus Niyogibacteria bacterium]|nr:DNA polymerase/3'-5' exonuclease PolX [Candidatus Niyogibacteria bacterium]
MKNGELAKIFFEMAELLAMKEVPFKPRAFEKAAHSLEALGEDVADIYKREGLSGLKKIPGVGAGIAERIEEFLKHGKIPDHARLKKQMPVDVSGLTAIEGVGPKTIRLLYKRLKIKTVKDLERAAKAGKLRRIPRMGVKLEEKILKSVEFQRTHAGRMTLGEALPISRSIIERLKKISGVRAVESAGSLRRWQETIGDLDFLVISSEPERVTDAFTSMPDVAAVTAKGETKSSVRLRAGINADLRVLPPESFGAALQYFTGSKDHNVELRKIAIAKGYKLNEYGLFKGERRIAGTNEEEIYEKLGLERMPPELRTNSGEIEAAEKHRLPKLIDYGDVRGDCQTQTIWTDGANSIEEMAEEAKRLGRDYIAITDHTKSLAMTHGSDEAKLRKQMAEIAKLNKKSGIRIFTGAEVNIAKDGALDISDEVLGELDFVGASVHSHFNLSEKEQTARLIRAMENPHVDAIFHPTTRVIQKRDAIALDFDEVFRAAARTGTMLEANAHPWRLDLKDGLIRRAKEFGVKFIIDTDAHSTAELSYLEYGIAQARRGWCAKKDIVNTLGAADFAEVLEKPKTKRFT